MEKHKKIIEQAWKDRSVLNDRETVETVENIIDG
jgi:hypothetical protein